MIVPGEIQKTDSNVNAYRVLKCMKALVPIVVFGLILTIVTFAITVVTLVKINKEFDQISIIDITTSTSPTVPTRSTSVTTSTQLPTNETLAASINIDNVMNHLQELERIAIAATGNRAVNTIGFNNTLDYIINTLKNHTNYNVTTRYFPVRQFVVLRAPIFISSINDTIRNHTYTGVSASSEFYYAEFSPSLDLVDYVELSVIPNVGCTDADWLAADPPPQGRAALVRRGICTFAEKATIASKYNITALLLYNNGQPPNGFVPILANLGQTNTVPALFLSYALGEELVAAAQDPATNVSVLINISVNDALGAIGNICADTPTGDPTQTILIGSHSDSVPAGPGINDNGSGSAANLELALTLARLFQTSTYAKYKYRIRFCWWGAEEIGLLGAAYHVAQAKTSNVTGERLSDYLINLNYDMLGSLNFMFGIYEGRTAPINTPVAALAGSNKITESFRSWFEQKNLPWNYTSFDGRSDYGPFLAEGIVAGGLFSGADGIKSVAEQNYYEQMLGPGLGGTAFVIHDPCYHRPCDVIANINRFGYEILVRGAANMLEYLARQDDLKTWLYPSGRVTHIDKQDQHRPPYDSINEYFRIPYV